MTEKSKIEYLRPDYIRFGREERRLSELMDKKQKDQSSSKKNKEKEKLSEKQEFEISDYVDRSAQLNASLNSLALSNMVKLKKLEKISKSKIDSFIDEKSKNKPEIFNPFKKIV